VKRVSRRSLWQGLRLRPLVKVSIGVSGCLLGLLLVFVLGDKFSGLDQTRSLQSMDCSEFVPVTDHGRFRYKGVKLCDGSKNYLYLYVL